MRSELKMVDYGRKWTDEEIRALLAIWSDATIQRQLLGATFCAEASAYVASKTKQKINTWKNAPNTILIDRRY